MQDGSVAAAGGFVYEGGGEVVPGEGAPAEGIPLFPDPSLAGGLVFYLVRGIREEGVSTTFRCLNPFRVG